jgi:hypothetical protein
MDDSANVFCSESTELHPSSFEQFSACSFVVGELQRFDFASCSSEQVHTSDTVFYREKCCLLLLLFLFYWGSWSCCLGEGVFLFFCVLDFLDFLFILLSPIFLFLLL